LPFIESINIADNMLTDVGMGPIILAAVNISSLLELNLSQNEIGPVSAKALFNYLINASCTLERLILNSADVDDYECERFVEAIKDNKSLLELELSHNKIGSAENLNTVMPDLITGGEALADLLRSENCRLKSLKLDWNLIRMDGAIDLANSIASNKTLTFLDLSYNSLSTQGGSKLCYVIYSTLSDII
jgi:Ran GTPase-activating protein (RanGAP) involved in mRNA processing and transport